MEITASILDYIGKYDDGILVSIGLMYKSKYYDAIFFYTVNKMLITVEQSMINDMKCQLEQHPDYVELMKSIILKCEPFDSVVDQLEDVTQIYNFQKF